MLKKIYEASAVYEGEYNMSSQYHGKGKITYKDGSYYDGEWENGKRHGFGIEWLYDGSSYRGYYQDDKRHGQGTYYSQNKQSYEVNFEYGIMDGEAVVTDGWGRKYKSFFYQGLEIKQVR